MFRGMSRLFWFVSFVSLVNCLDRLLWDTVPAGNLFVCHRTAISRRSLRITRHRWLILIACAILLHGSIPLLQFHLRLIFNNFELVDLLYMLLGVRLVCSLAVSTEMCILVIMELLLYWPPKLDLLVEVMLNIAIDNFFVNMVNSAHWTSLEAYYLFVLWHSTSIQVFGCYGSWFIFRLWHNLEIRIHRHRLKFWLFLLRIIHLLMAWFHCKLQFLSHFLLLPKFLLCIIEHLLFFAKVMELEICIAHRVRHLQHIFKDGFIFACC